ncbi:MAG: hypothetical protein ABSE49_00760 [Polyangiaceae bacterium]
MNPYPPPNAPYAQPPPQGYPQAPPPPTAEDESQLNTLSICHYIYAGLLGVFGIFGIIYVIFGVLLATASLGGGGSPGGPPPAAVGGIVAAIGGFITLLLWAKAACVAYSGMNLKKRQKRTFSFVIACICCMNIPLGTALGIFTLVVLSRQSVRAIYDRVAYYGA